ncbi:MULTISPECIES: acetylserotonin O-methyltransferase [unclassified Crossiella]|uniref:acetylserotonin O-methyltransferase n=1 Tax=unclassified Crossiella TaxID=2620835 RepID=UPI001FFFB8F1|nr:MULTISPECIES: acetylserotonin O-methyltransferase [unclassified Crossiella]MCK2244832.1 acetylserotonin O-methyltransferase [Crossiella sp. S99.2]MCK2258474.1 acetylserotonin O-methyltransferase [Crossiella sp. S99.1]
MTTTPTRLNELFWARWQSKVLQSAIRLGVCTELAGGPRTAEELAQALDLRGDRRATQDFLDSLTAVELLHREGDQYRNSAEAATYLDERTPGTYLGDALAQMLDLQDFDLTAALRLGAATGDGRDFYQRQYGTEQGARLFLRLMTAFSLGAASVLATKFPWQHYTSVADLGCAEGALLTRILARQPHLSAIGFDLPAAETGFTEHTTALGFGDRAEFRAGDFFQDPLPAADVLIFGQVLHNWNLAEKQQLIAKAYQSLTPGGALIIDESLAGTGENFVAAILSLLMNLSVGGGFDLTGAECENWLRQAGFTNTSIEHLTGSRSMVVGFKPAVAARPYQPQATSCLL